MCQVNFCILQQQGPAGCVSGAVSHLTMGASPYQIVASEIVPGGYSFQFCYGCQASYPSSSLHYFYKDQIAVTQDPLNCLTSLASNPSFNNQFTIPYKSSGSSVTLANEYSDIFIHT